MPMLQARNKLLLLLGIVIPAALVIFIWLMRYLHHTNIQPPQYNFIYAVKNYGPYTLTIENNGVILVNKNPPQSANAQAPRQELPQIFLYNIQTNQVEPLQYQQPADLTIAKSKVLAFDKHLIDPRPLSPDGFTFSNKYTQAYLLDISSSRGRYEIFLSKSGKRFPLNITQDHYQVQFLGWLTPVENHER